MDFALQTLCTHTPSNAGVKSNYCAFVIHNPLVDDNKALLLVLVTTHLHWITFI